MVGYKSISELSLKECYDLLQNERNSADKMHLNRMYQELVEKNRASDNWAFMKCKTISDYENYIKQYDVYYYVIQHKEEAYEAINVIRQKEEERLRMQKLAQEEEFFWSENKKSLHGCETYLNTYPSGRYVEEATRRKNVYEGLYSLLVIPIGIGYFLLGIPLSSITDSDWIIMLFFFAPIFIIIIFFRFFLKK